MRELKLFIDGEFTDAAGGETYESINPANREPVATVARGGAEDVAQACRAAQRAFAGEWARWPAPSAGPHGHADLIEARTSSPAEMLDVGKPITEATAIDAAAAVGYLRWCAGVTDAAGARPSAADRRADRLLRPARRGGPAP